MQQAEIPFSLTNHLLVHNNIINLASENEVVEKLSNKLNQHWVPQYHLKLFSNGNRYIHLALRDGSCMAFKTSIKGQCARHRFYGNEKVEEWLSTLESRHAAAYRAVLQIADPPSQWISLRTSDDTQLRQALLLQRARTPRNAHVSGSSIDQAALHTYREYLSALPPNPQQNHAINAIDQGRASLKNSEFMSLMLSLHNACRMVKIIKDLRLLILRNQTNDPFVLGDNPCVLSNRHMSDVDEHGVLGYATRGLMISMPINSKIQVLLIDRAVYRVPCYPSDCVNITKREDVSSLNALQIYAAQKRIYFADETYTDYVKELITQHPPQMDDHKGGFNVLHNVSHSVAKHRANSEILHMYEPQLPVSLDLSFIKVRERSPGLNLNSPRKPAIVERMENSIHAGTSGKALGIDELVRWVETELIIQ